MKEFKGTSGPWGVSFHGANNCWVVDSDKDKPIAKILKIENSAEQQKANFNLIAAAPELLELVISANLGATGSHTVAWQERAQAAIKKALGESQ